MNLKKGGKLYLESAIYHSSEDENACRFIHGYGGDRTNYWALSPSVIRTLLETYGLSRVEQFKDIQIQSYKGTGMSRGLFYAEK